MKEDFETEIKERFSTIIEKKKKQLEEYDHLPLSMFREMFGDSIGFEESDDAKKQRFSDIVESINKQKELIERSIKFLEDTGASCRDVACSFHTDSEG